MNEKTFLCLRAGMMLTITSFYLSIISPSLFHFFLLYGSCVVVWVSEFIKRWKMIDKRIRLEQTYGRR